MAATIRSAFAIVSRCRSSRVDGNSFAPEFAFPPVSAQHRMVRRFRPFQRPPWHRVRWCWRRARKRECGFGAAPASSVAIGASRHPQQNARPRTRAVRTRVRVAEVPIGHAPQRHERRQSRARNENETTMRAAERRHSSADIRLSTGQSQCRLDRRSDPQRPHVRCRRVGGGTCQPARRDPLDSRRVAGGLWIGQIVMVTFHDGAEPVRLASPSAPPWSRSGAGILGRERRTACQLIDCRAAMAWAVTPVASVMSTTG
jgi:hypothetical protein